MQLLVYPPTQYFNFLLPSEIKYANLEVPFSRAKFMLWHLGIKHVGNDLEQAVLKNLHTLLMQDESVKLSMKKRLSVDLIPDEYKKNKAYYDGYQQLDDSLIYPNRLSESESRVLELMRDKLINVFDIGMSPGLADDDSLKKMPKTFVVVCEFDSRKDEALIYAQRLVQNGVTVKVEFYEQAFHGMILDDKNPIAVDMRNKIAEFVKDHI